MAAKCRKYSACSLVLLGNILLLVGIILVSLNSLKKLAENKIKERVQLKPGSKSFEKWEKPATRLREYYMFNITDLNAANGSIPKVKQLGPYAYSKKISYNITKQANGTITYVPTFQYIFNQAKSCKQCDPIRDKITTLNYPLLILTRLVSVNINGSKPTANYVFGKLKSANISLFQTRSVQEILWGYQDKTFARVASSILHTTFVQFYALQGNNSGSGMATIYTGETDVNKVGEYAKWKQNRTLSWWKNVTANMINGTDGGRFAPLLDKDDDLYILVPEICRSVKLQYESSVEVDDIDVYRFTLPEDTLESGDNNKNNEGFCVTGSEKMCLPDGLLNINGCLGGVEAPPVVASLPHFYFGNMTLPRTFALTPIKSTDETYLDIEPITGLTMRFHKRLQLNMAVPDFSVLSLLLNFDESNPVYFPIFFTDESAQISNSDASDFKKQVLVPLRATEAVPYALIGVGALFLLIALVIIFVHFRRRTYYA